jgi:hypothetical protein
MNDRPDRCRRLPPGVILPLALALASCQNAYADSRPDPRPGYPPGAASASASAPAAEPEPAPKSTDGRKPWVPELDVPFVEGTSPAPTNAEWAAATVAVEARVTDPGCKVLRLREWYRVGCRTPWIELVAGTRQDVSFGCRRDSKDSIACDESWVVLPAHRGDRRVLELFGWSKWGPSPDAILTEQFLEGDPGPLVTVHGLRWGF